MLRSKNNHSWPRLVILQEENTQSWPKLVMPRSEQALSRPTECSIQMPHNQSWPKKVILLQKNDQSRPRLVILGNTWYHLVALLHYLLPSSTISRQYCTTCGQIVPRLPQYGTTCEHLIPSTWQYGTTYVHLIPSRGNMVLLANTWYHLAAILHYLWTLDTISWQSCTTYEHI